MDSEDSTRFRKRSLFCSPLKNSKNSLSDQSNLLRHKKIKTEPTTPQKLLLSTHEKNSPNSTSPRRSLLDWSKLQQNKTYHPLEESDTSTDSFDLPVDIIQCSPLKRRSSKIIVSPVYKLNDKENDYISSNSVDACETLTDTAIKNNDVTEFLLSNGDKSIVDLTVKEVRNEEGCMDLICTTSEGHDSIVYLQDQWADSKCDPGARIRLIGAKKWGDLDWLVSNDNGILITSPDILVRCTSIASSLRCARKVILYERFQTGCEPNKSMLIGSIIHEMFQASVRCSNPLDVTRDWLLHLWRSSIVNGVIQSLCALRFSPSQFELELEPYADVIVNWIRSHMPSAIAQSLPTTSFVTEVHDIEENIWLPQLGMKGRIDVTFKTKRDSVIRFEPLELKTGKSNHSTEHYGQVLLYCLMLAARDNQPISDGLLLYMKDGVSRPVIPRSVELKGLLSQRNRLAYYLHKHNLEKLPEARVDPRFCENCDQALTCSMYQIGLEENSSVSEKMFDFTKQKTAHLNTEHFDYFKKWISWIYCEWGEEDLKKGHFVSDLWNINPDVREAAGHCISHLKLVSQTRISENGYLLRLERTSPIRESILSPGCMCTVSTATKFGLLISLIVEFNDNSVTIRSGRLIDSSEIYHLDVYYSFSNYSTYLGNVLTIMGPEKSTSRYREQIVNLCLPQVPCLEERKLSHVVQKILNSANVTVDQRKAIVASLSANDYILIEGLPGAGKTTTITVLIRCLVALGRSVLLTSNTHSSVDNVLTKLMKFMDKSKLLRLGKESSMKVETLELSLKAKTNTEHKDNYEKTRQILKETPVVACTCHHVPREILFSWRRFDVCIVDEASMVLEPVVISSISVASKFVLVGDKRQLGPIVQNRKAREEGMAISLFERLHIHEHIVFSLESQFRMNRVITNLASKLFYDGRLKCANEDVATACLEKIEYYRSSASWGDPYFTLLSGNLNDSCVFVDTRSNEAKEYRMTNEEGGLQFNAGEAHLVSTLCHQFLKCGMKPSEIGIMCVYRKQVDVIKGKLNVWDVEVNTVDQYQGRDKSIIIWSLVWTESSGKRCELLNDDRRVNVALSRAKHKLVLVGCKESMQNFNTLTKIIEEINIVIL